MSKEGRRRVREKKEICPNANKLSTKMPSFGRVGDQMAPQYRYESYRWKHSISTGKWFARTMSPLTWNTGCRDWVKDTERSYCGTEFVHRTKSSGPKRRVGVAREEGSRKRTNLMYANTIYGVLEYHSMYFLYYNKNQ